MTVMTGGAFCALLIAAPALAGQSLVTPSGAVLEVWQQRGQVISGGNDVTDGSAIRFAVTDIGGRREGFLAGTADAARDQHPRLALDPRTGDAVAVWSRWDGSVQKIAYARFDGRVWHDQHMLTFGPGDDRQPRIGIGRDGAVLFWISGRGRHMYAPVELSAGHLMAPGRPIHPSAERPSSGQTSLTSPGDSAIQGNSDIPIWTYRQGCSSSGNSMACSTSYSGGLIQLPKGDESVQGTSDVPIILVDGYRSPTWAVASSPGCRRQVIALPARDARFLDLLVLENDTIRPTRRMTVPSPTPQEFGANASSSLLASICE
jgi:hypothetical protein